jgi:probable HAF family extracellular repeat protein
MKTKHVAVLIVAALAVSACDDPTSPLPSRAPTRAEMVSTAGREHACRWPSVFDVTITALRTLRGFTDAEAVEINNQSEAVGMSEFPGSAATLWPAPDAPVDLTSRNASSATALDINDAGEVLISPVASGDFIWSRQQGARSIPDPSLGSFFDAAALNNDAHVTGVIVKSAVAEHGGIWSPQSGFRDIGVLPGGNLSEPSDINNNDEVVGIGNRDHGSLFDLEAQGHAFLWTPGDGMQDLGTPAGVRNAHPTAINDQRQIAGYSQNENAAFFAWRWTQESGFERLGSVFQGGESSQALDIDAQGLAVGQAISESGASAAVLWTPDGAAHNLGGFAPGDGARASGVNDEGQVVGNVTTQQGTRAVRWTLSSVDNAPGILIALSNEVRRLADVGALRPADAGSLQSLLDDLHRRIAEPSVVGQPGLQALANRFAGQVNALVDAGHLSRAVARSLTSKAECVILLPVVFALP